MQLLDGKLTANLLKDEIAAEVMQLIDGKSSIIDIVDILVKKFKGASKDVVKKDVLSLLQPLAEKGFIVI